MKKFKLFLASYVGTISPRAAKTGKTTGAKNSFAKTALRVKRLRTSIQRDKFERQFYLGPF